MNFQGVEHALPGYDDLFRLFFHWQTTDERCHFFCCLPFGELTKTFLPCPDTCVDNLQEELARARIEDEYGTIDRLGRQVAFARLVNCDPVNVGVIDKPDHLVGEQLTVVLRV